MTENERIASLTSGAIRVSGEKMVSEIEAVINAAEEAAKQLRGDGEQLILAIRKHTNVFADRVNSFVANCSDATDSFQIHQNKIVDDVLAEEQPATPPKPRKEEQRKVPLLITDKDLAETRRDRVV